jgi:HlyD family secretion protein
MKRNQIIAVVLAVAVIAGVLYWRHATREEVQPYRFTSIERGNLEAAVSATGTLSAVTTVQVGTQVSGKIVEIFADFNDPVKKGQLVARIDPVIQEAAVREAQANLERNRAEFEQAKREYERNRGLFERKVLTEVEFNNAKYAYEVAQANVKSAEVSLSRARQNLAYTRIYAPVDGVVVERTVDVGQTVAASLSAPQLFLIANDLSQMQILASVDESDIGSIKEDQPARFTVQAYPNQAFMGKVKKVRLQSKTQENVVNYTVEVAVENRDGKLLPGMTATVEFVTGSANDVLMVSNSALRFRPTEEMIAEVRKAREAERGGEAGNLMSDARRNGSAENGGPVSGSVQPDGAPRERMRIDGPTGPRDGAVRGPDGAGTGRGAFGGPGGAAAGRGVFGPGAGAGRLGRPRNVAMLWYLNETGELAVARVRTGITDGTRTEIIGRNIKEGQQIIIGVTQTEAQRSSNPFQQSGPPGGMRRIGPGF